VAKQFFPKKSPEDIAQILVKPEVSKRLVEVDEASKAFHAIGEPTFTPHDRNTIEERKGAAAARRKAEAEEKKCELVEKRQAALEAEKERQRAAEEKKSPLLITLPDWEAEQKRAAAALKAEEEKKAAEDAEAERKAKLAEEKRAAYEKQLREEQAERARVQREREQRARARKETEEKTREAERLKPLTWRKAKQLDYCECKCGCKVGGCCGTGSGCNLHSIDAEGDRILKPWCDTCNKQIAGARGRRRNTNTNSSVRKRSPMRRSKRKLVSTPWNGRRLIERFMRESIRCEQS